jgi:hypothetical protein
MARRPKSQPLQLDAGGFGIARQYMFDGIMLQRMHELVYINEADPLETLHKTVAEILVRRLLSGPLWPVNDPHMALEARAGDANCTAIHTTIIVHNDIVETG